MHDQKKEKRVLTPEEVAAAAAEHERVGVLYKAVLHYSKVHDYPMELLDITEQLLLAVPDAYTAYNCRRRALETVWKHLESHTETAAAPTLTRQEWLQKELKLNSKVLLLNYKNYNAFVHRHWVFGQIEALAKAELMEVENAGKGTAPTFELLQQLLHKERTQCEQLLQMDERNFHAWNYRRWVLAQEYRASALAGASPLTPFTSFSFSGVEGVKSGRPDAGIGDNKAREDAITFAPDEAAEMAYTKQKIKNNFSNYSAWHQRSLALKSAVARWREQRARAAHRGSPSTTAEEKHRKKCHSALLAQLREDVGFLEQAIYCDPNDQSAWFYAPFVLQLLQSQQQSAAEAAEAAVLTDVFVTAVIDLIAEVDRVGTEDECYLPYYFLLDQFITLQAAHNEESQAMVTRYTGMLHTKVSSLAASAMDSTGGARLCCIGFLHERLCKADVLRKGLYDDMLKKATRSAT